MPTLMKRLNPEPDRPALRYHFVAWGIFTLACLGICAGAASLLWMCLKNS